jgi:N-acetylglucosaminyldiphosphoundecaprenol N-acetyl-beta-D-mannosaminyltransferase
VRLDCDKSLWAAYAAAWITVNDSRIIETLAGFFGICLLVCPGSDLTKTIFETLIEPGEPVVSIGANAMAIRAPSARARLDAPGEIGMAVSPVTRAKDIMAALSD